MDAQGQQVELSRKSGRKFSTYLALLLAALVAATSTGCVTTQPHVTAKVIFQDESGVAAEVSSEWR